MTADPLPQPTGPYQVGFIDLEWVPEKTTATPNPPEFVFGRLFYPSSYRKSIDGNRDNVNADNGDGEENWNGKDNQDEEDNYTNCEKKRAPWIPSAPYFASTAISFLVACTALKTTCPICRWYAGKTRIWAFEDAKLTSVIPFPDGFPVILFSHGLASFRTSFTALATELASYGLIIVAVEHRDGSASMTLDNQIVRPYQHPPKENRKDQQFRTEQLEHRARELSATIDMLERVNCGAKLTTIWIHSKEARQESEQVALLNSLANKLDLGRISSMGHSFGGVTAMFSAFKDHRISCVVSLDPWMFPLPSNFQTTMLARQHIPMIVVNAGNFQWPENLVSIKRVLYLAKTTELPHSRQVTLEHAEHISFSDFPLVFPSYVIRIFRKQSQNDLEVVTKAAIISIAFLKEALKLTNLTSKYALKDLEKISGLRQDFIV